MVLVEAVLSGLTSAAGAGVPGATWYLWRVASKSARAATRRAGAIACGLLVAGFAAGAISELTSISSRRPVVVFGHSLFMATVVVGLVAASSRAVADPDRFDDANGDLR